MMRLENCEFMILQENCFDPGCNKENYSRVVVGQLNAGVYFAVMEFESGVVREKLIIY